MPASLSASSAECAIGTRMHGSQMLTIRKSMERSSTTSHRSSCRPPPRPGAAHHATWQGPQPLMRGMTSGIHPQRTAPSSTAATSTRRRAGTSRKAKGTSTRLQHTHFPVLHPASLPCGCQGMPASLSWERQPQHGAADRSTLPCSNARRRDARKRSPPRHIGWWRHVGSPRRDQGRVGKRIVVPVEMRFRKNGNDDHMKHGNVPRPGNGTIAAKPMPRKQEGRPREAPSPGRPCQDQTEITVTRRSRRRCCTSCRR
jgi:hypothetical protein